MSFSFQRALAGLNASAAAKPLEMVGSNMAIPLAKGPKRPRIALGSLHGNPLEALNDGPVGPLAGARAIDLIFSRGALDGNRGIL